MNTLDTSNTHSRTVTAFFDTRDAANKAIDDLVAAGISRDKVKVPQDLTDHKCINLRLPTHGGL